MASVVLDLWWHRHAFVCRDTAAEPVCPGVASPPSFMARTASPSPLAIAKPHRLREGARVPALGWASPPAGLCLQVCSNLPVCTCVSALAVSVSAHCCHMCLHMHM